MLTDGIWPHRIGGMQKHSYYLAKYLSKYGVEVDLYHTHNSAINGDPLSCFTDEERKNIRSFVFEFPSLSKFPRHYLKETQIYSKLLFDHLIKEKKVDFIYAKGYTAVHFLQQKTNTPGGLPPIGIRMHGYEIFQTHRGLKDFYWRKLYLPLVRFLNREADYIYSYGGGLTPLIENNLPGSHHKIIEIPAGIEASWLTDKAPITNATLKFIFVGRYDPRKGVRQLQAALKCILADYDFEFHFVGPVPERFKIHSSKIKYHGMLSDVSQIQVLLRNSDIFVLPSHSEGMPNVILEAMASGLAILSTRVGAVDVMVSEKNGWLIPPLDVGALTGMLRLIFSLSPQEITAKKRNSLEKVKAHFLWEAIIQQEIEAIKIATASPGSKRNTNFKSKQSKVFLSHSGKQHAYQVAKNLYDSGRLETFRTSAYLTSGILQKCMLATQNKFFTRRFISGLPGNKIDANWRYEMSYFLSKRISMSSSATEEKIYQWDMRFDRDTAEGMKHFRGGIFWGFQGSCFQSLQAARARGKFTICELSTAHVKLAKQILSEEIVMHPEWMDSISNFNFPATFEKRLEEEPFIAHRVFAASDFTRDSLTAAGISSDKIRILPLGADLDRVRFAPRRKDLPNRPLRLLYAGTVTQRKGIKYLLEAMKTFSAKDVELHIIGGIFGSQETFKNYRDQYFYHGTLPQQELLNCYTEYDALVLPTIFEGFALVIIEALAAGLPVIATPHCIAPDVVEEGKNGFIIPIRDISALSGAIQKMRNLSDDELEEMSNYARLSAQKFTWAQHRNRMNLLLEEIDGALK